MNLKLALEQRLQKIAFYTRVLSVNYKFCGREIILLSKKWDKMALRYKWSEQYDTELREFDFPAFHDPVVEVVI